MNAAEVIREATAVGIQIAIQGGDLLLEAAAPPPEAVIELLSRHKPDILNLLRSGRGGLVEAFAQLESKCPDHVDVERWQQCIRDGRHFLESWGPQAEALGWTAKDLFGLHKPPLQPHPSYRRLSRYDETGLCWLLQRRRVLALTETTAAIQSSGGSPTIYRKYNKPTLGPLGDSLEDFV
jgi:hypothetical protein